MSRPRALLPTLSVVLAVAGCTPTTDLSGLGAHDDSRVTSYRRVGTTQGSSVAVTQDERIAVVCSRTDGVVSVIRLHSSAELGAVVEQEPIASFSFPAPALKSSKPWQAVIAPDDDTAYVLVRGLGEVVRIQKLHSAPALVGSIGVGSEPTSIVISPTGKTLYVANWGEGSVTAIVRDGLVAVPWDLNYRLAKTGLLGPLVAASETDSSAVWSPDELQNHRPGLAHPRALAITDDGDENDADETLYATEFFSQPGDDASLQDPDRNRQGLVYPFDLETGRAPLDASGNPIDVIRLPPVMDTGFADAAGMQTGCVPNQLSAAAVEANRLYVTAMCASPAGPVDVGPPGMEQNNFRTLMHPVVFTIDVDQNVALPEPLVLTRDLQRLYNDDGAAPADRRMPLIPSAIALTSAVAGKPTAYVTAYGASAVFPLGLDPSGSFELGQPQRRFIPLGNIALPTGLAVLKTGRMLAADDFQRALHVVDLASGEWNPVDYLDGWLSNPELDRSQLLSDEARTGRHLFATGLGGWSLDGQAWSSCESCHPDGLSDNITWRFDRGPRRTPSLAGTYHGESGVRRAMLWGGHLDELHDFERVVRRTSGGVGGLLWERYATTSPTSGCRLLYDGSAPKEDAANALCSQQMRTTTRLTGLAGALSSLGNERCDRTLLGQGDLAVCDQDPTQQWRDIDAFVRTIRAPIAPRNLDAALVEEGRALFIGQRCHACHGGPRWTLSRVFYTPDEVNNGRLPYAPASAASMEPAQLLGLLRTTSYEVPAALNQETATSRWFRAAPQTQVDVTNVIDYVYGQGAYKDAPPVDQLTCVLRSVGTFPDQSLGENRDGIVPAGAAPLHEVRRVLNAQAEYEDQLAQGVTGFNIPSLLGLSGGGPYFHAGNARSLEESFDSVFSAHYAALSPDSEGQAPGVASKPAAQQIRALVSFLLSIDESDERVPIPAPSVEQQEISFEPDLCKGFEELNAMK